MRLPEREALPGGLEIYLSRARKMKPEEEWNSKIIFSCIKTRIQSLSRKDTLKDDWYTILWRPWLTAWRHFINYLDASVLSDCSPAPRTFSCNFRSAVLERRVFNLSENNRSFVDSVHVSQSDRRSIGPPNSHVRLGLPRVPRDPPGVFAFSPDFFTSLGHHVCLKLQDILLFESSIDFQEPLKTANPKTGMSIQTIRRRPLTYNRGKWSRTDRHPRTAIAQSVNFPAQQVGTWYHFPTHTPCWECDLLGSQSCPATPFLNYCRSAHVFLHSTDRNQLTVSPKIAGCCRIPRTVSIYIWKKRKKSSPGIPRNAGRERPAVDSFELSHKILRCRDAGGRIRVWSGRIVSGGPRPGY
ncbi:unnamed protein product [Nesidiocoris tenuis]|uniref:Uncharacterized protein n=1 Tax=Nesidiocoris tenuis TaxID=355587 RepID=A0A6H5GIM9_9HEMI|nr:unnamed protein product [Nesidiocoris tenuis]